MNIDEMLEFLDSMSISDQIKMDFIKNNFDKLTIEKLQSII